MDNDKVLALAKQAGFNVHADRNGRIQLECDHQAEWDITDELLAFAQALTPVGDEPETFAIDDGGLSLFEMSIGKEYEPKYFGKFESHHPETIKHLMQELNDTPTADVVAGLAWALSLADNRAKRFAKDLQARASMPVKDGWMPIETAPKDAEILLRSKGGSIANGSWGTAPNNWANPPAWVWPYINMEPVEWMPLPAPTALSTVQDQS